MAVAIDDHTRKDDPWDGDLKDLNLVITALATFEPHMSQVDNVHEKAKSDAGASSESSELGEVDETLPGPAIARSKLKMFAILAALFLSLFIAALDQSIVATAIPTISAQLHSASGYTWIGGAYFLANAAAAPIWSKLSDIWGRKPILLAAVATFFGSSIICARASSMKMLIVGRSLQGTAGGGLILLVNVVISDLFSMRYRFPSITVIWSGF